MFCMNCGLQLPDGAKFCLQCGTPLGEVSTAGSTQNTSGTISDILLQRVEILLADGDFNGAMSKCYTILHSDPTNGRVYFFMLLADLRCKNRTELAKQAIPFDGNQYYIKTVQYCDAGLKAVLADYINAINARNDAKLKNPKVGDIFYYGSYNGQRIFWKVLRIQDRTALIISFNNICNIPYHQPGGNITWSDCTLRKWLNNDFIYGSFSQTERAKILPCKLNNDNNQKYKTPGGDPTNDKVFLLSINEANTLFANDQARTIDSWWWLRSPGGDPGSAAYVNTCGEVRTYGSDVRSNGGICPVLWLDFTL